MLKWTPLNIDVHSKLKSMVFISSAVRGFNVVADLNFFMIWAALYIVMQNENNNTV